MIHIFAFRGSSARILRVSCMVVPHVRIFTCVVLDTVIRRLAGLETSVAGMLTAAGGRWVFPPHCEDPRSLSTMESPRRRRLARSLIGTFTKFIFSSSLRTELLLTVGEHTTPNPVFC